MWRSSWKVARPLVTSTLGCRTNFSRAGTPLNTHLSQFLKPEIWNPRTGSVCITSIHRTFHSNHVLFEKEPLKPSSKVEESVLALKEDIKSKEESATKAVAPAKPPLSKRIMDELKHYYHGFRLLFIEARISFQLALRVLQGESLSRRERKQLVRTTSDLFRLVPFSVFIIVPFMEFLLPVFLKFFPGMLPSTFQTANEREAKLKASLKVKLETAKFLQETLDEMALKGQGHHSEKAKEFVDFFKKVRISGQQATTEEIMRFSKLFEDEITLDSLSRPQLLALCRVLEIQPIGTSNFLRFQLRMKLRSLAADDKMIQKEGVDSLTIAELQQACRARGMRALGLSESRLRFQLQQWLALSLNEKVPPSLLLLSRTLFLPETVPTTDQLKATISMLPESVVTQTQDAIGEREGKIDNKARIEAIKVEERKIKEEREEKRKAEAEAKLKPVSAAPEVAIPAAHAALAGKAGELLVDQAPILRDKATELLAKKEELTSEDVAALEDALETIGVKRKKLLIEKEELDELKEEMAEYQEDVDDLRLFLRATSQEGISSGKELRESKGARRLFRSVNSMISSMDKVVEDLQKEQNKLKKRLENQGEEEVAAAPPTEAIEELVSVEELIGAIRKLQKVNDTSKLQQIAQVLGQMDNDRDGVLKVEDVLKVIELLGKEEVKLSPKQVSEIVEMLDKEEILEIQEKIGKALGKRGEEDLRQKKTTFTETIHKPDRVIERTVTTDPETRTLEANTTITFKNDEEGKQVQVEEQEKTTLNPDQTMTVVKGLKSTATFPAAADKPPQPRS